MMRATSATAVLGLLVGLVAAPILSNRSALAEPTPGPGTTTPEHVIAVNGAGVVSISPDVADVSIGVSATESTAKAARDQAAKAMSAVIAAIKKNGVDAKDISTTNVSLEPVYESSSSKPRLVGYQFGNTVRVTVRDLDKLPAVIDDSVGAGATLVHGIAFRVDDPKAAQAQARDAAMADARAKADALARAGGVTIKGVASISETSYSPVSVMYDKAYAGALAASTPVETGTTDVRVQVSVTYLIG